MSFNALDKKKSQWIVSHIGAREHYVISRAFEELELLHSLNTDFYLSEEEVRLLNLFGINDKRLQNRTNRYLPIKKVNRQFFLKLQEFNNQRRFSNPFDFWVWQGRRFGDNIVKKMLGNRSDDHCFWGYTCGNLEILKYSNKLGNLNIHDQIDPFLDYYNKQLELWSQHRSVEDKPRYPTNAYIERIQEELEIAREVVVNSEYSRNSLVKAGVKSEKIKIIPLSYDEKVSGVVKRKKEDKPIAILWVGNINLIKGFYNFYSVAEKLHNNGFIFTAVGATTLKEEFLQKASKYISFTGRQSKSEINRIYTTHDVFVFPSYSDGFGMVQLEAMAHGLPVIASTTCGDVVTDNFNGLILKRNEPEELLETVLYFKEHPTELERMSSAALQTSKKYTLEALKKNLKSLIIETS